MSNMAYQTCQQNQMPVRGKRARRGAATLWIILCLPAVLCLIGVVVETGNLLLARIELTNALEAGALSGVDEWSDFGNTPANRTASRSRAVALVASNTMTGTSLSGAVSANGGGGGANENSTCTGNVVILGSGSNAALDFNAGTDPTLPGRYFAVRVQASMSVNSIIGTLCGVAVGPFNVTTEATAGKLGGGITKLYSPSSVICPGP
jgi:Flp pilus assembly protein TadG